MPTDDRSGVALIDRARGYGDRVAILAQEGTFTYERLLRHSAAVASTLIGGSYQDLNESRVAFLVEPSYGYVATQWGIWRAGGIAVPIGTSLPDPEIRYVLEDSEPAVAIADERFADRVERLSAEYDVKFLRVDQLMDGHAVRLPALGGNRASMMLYTSGTTGRPKGVVHTHDSITAQIRSLVDAWAWRADDRILLVLPLHHVHGIVNVLSCALWSGATCEMLSSFDAAATWDRIATGQVSLFMAVPTIYHRLIDAWEAADDASRMAMSRGAEQMRLMVSGSAALPVPTLERWEEITGHTLLERYGMTEIGMALSNTLDERTPGHVGVPLPNVEVKLITDGNSAPADGSPGEIHVRGPQLFREYWRRPEATAEAFETDWFRTGDIAVIEEGQYRILGRESVDIIKTGGEKVSALEVEDVLRTHPLIDDCAVVGVPDDDWGERVCAALVGTPGSNNVPVPEEVRAWTKERLAPHKVPREFLTVDELPRNALGKVTKPDVKQMFVGSS